MTTKRIGHTAVRKFKNQKQKSEINQIGKQQNTNVFMCQIFHICVKHTLVYLKKHKSPQQSGFHNKSMNNCQKKNNKLLK